MSTSMDQTAAQLSSALDKAIYQHRESLARKRERHGKKFDNAAAQQHLFNQLLRMPKEASPALLSAAINRLAQMPDFNPYTEVQHLDFDLDPPTE